jgi:hypothetical protein
MKKSKSCEEMIGHNEIQNLNENNELFETISLQLDASIDEPRHNRFAKENRQKLILQQQVIDQKVKLTRAQKQLEDAAKRQRRATHGFFARISATLKRPTTISASIVTESADNTNNIPNQSAIIHPSYVDNQSNDHQQLFNVSHVSLPRPQEEEDFDKSPVSYISDKRISQYQQQQSSIYNVNEDRNLSDDNPNSTYLSTNNTTLEGGDEMILTAAKLASHIMPSSSSSSFAINNKTSSSTATPLC